jgi:hypothetical protein
LRHFCRVNYFKCEIKFSTPPLRPAVAGVFAVDGDPAVADVPFTGLHTLALHDFAGTQCVVGVSFDSIVTGVQALALVHADAGTLAIAGTYAVASTHDVADVSAVVGPAVAGCSIMTLLLLVLPTPMAEKSSGPWSKCKRSQKTFPA